MTNTPIITLTARRRSGHAVVHVHRAGQPSRRYRVSLARYKSLRERALDWICLPGLHANSWFFRTGFGVNVFPAAAAAAAPSSAEALAVDAFGFTQQASPAGIDLSTSARCKRLAHAMGISCQSAYLRVARLAEELGIGRGEALNRLEAQSLPAGACR